MIQTNPPTEKKKEEKKRKEESDLYPSDVDLQYTQSDLYEKKIKNVDLHCKLSCLVIKTRKLSITSFYYHRI